MILWGGGIYNWFDPLTLIRAMAVLADRRPQARCCSWGGKHPNPTVPEMRMAVEARPSPTRSVSSTSTCSSTTTGSVRRTAELPARGRHRRQHPPGPCRDRVLVPDAHPRLSVAWLPIVCTDGDSFSSIIRDEGIGEVVAAGLEGLARRSSGCSPSLRPPHGVATTSHPSPPRTAGPPASNRWPRILPGLPVARGLACPALQRAPPCRAWPPAAARPQMR